MVMLSLHVRDLYKITVHSSVTKGYRRNWLHSITHLPVYPWPKQKPKPKPVDEPLNWTMLSSGQPHSCQAVWRCCGQSASGQSQGLSWRDPLATVATVTLVARGRRLWISAVQRMVVRHLAGVVGIVVAVVAVGAAKVTEVLFFASFCGAGCQKTNDLVGYLMIVLVIAVMESYDGQEGPAV